MERFEDAKGDSGEGTEDVWDSSGGYFLTNGFPEKTEEDVFDGVGADVPASGLDGLFFFYRKEQRGV